MMIASKATTKQEPDLARVKELIREARDSAQKANRKRNLILLWSVLESIRAEGSRYFSIAEVGRRMESEGGMRTQSLRNKGAIYFRQIIAEYEEAVRIKGSAQISLNGDSAKRALELIPDPLAKAVLEGYVRQARKLREENNMLRETCRKIHLPINLSEESGNQTLPKKFNFDPELFDILKKALNPKIIMRWGKIQQDGGIHDIQGCEIFPRRFMEAIEATIRFLSDSCEGLS